MKDRIERLKKIKEETGVSLEKLAPMIGISMFTLTRWLRGVTRIPHPSSIKALDIFFTEYERAKKEGNVKSYLGLIV